MHSYCVELGILFLLLSFHLISLYSWKALQRHSIPLAVKGHGKLLSWGEMLVRLQQPLLILAGVDELHQDELLHVFMEDVFQSPTPLLPQPRPEFLQHEEKRGRMRTFQ